MAVIKKEEEESNGLSQSREWEEDNFQTTI
ncbi:uncharacterized protein G2W53_009693 [Senna tora]|uniref:Uncharacterized protein n=1 Tax=Senna tora TaxID=362788 RepID=A0A834WYE2_9FABA|nr:uncharacterized protein G2W53_009693 [Senna tora]